MTVATTQSPKLTATKTVDRAGYGTVGEPIGYTVTVKNEGNVTVADGAALTLEEFAAVAVIDHVASEVLHLTAVGAEEILERGEVGERGGAVGYRVGRVGEGAHEEALGEGVGLDAVDGRSLLGARRREGAGGQEQRREGADRDLALGGRGGGGRGEWGGGADGRESRERLAELLVLVLVLGVGN